MGRGYDGGMIWVTYVLLILLTIVPVVIQVATGRIYTRWGEAWGKVILRAENPRSFWWCIAGECAFLPVVWWFIFHEMIPAIRQVHAG